MITPHVDAETARRISLLRARGSSVVLWLVLSEDTDPASVHRAAGLGVPVVELRPGVSLGASTAAVVGAR